jgi:hypothetical protein
MVVLLSPTVYRPSTRGRVWRLLGCMAFMLVCGGLLASHLSVVADVMMVLGLLVFGLNAALGLYLLVRSSALILDAEGMSYDVFGRVSWSEIDRVRLQKKRVNFASVRFIEVILRDESRHSRRAAGVGRVLGVGNRALGYSPICIPSDVLPALPATFIQAMRRYYPELRVEGPADHINPRSL